MKENLVFDFDSTFVQDETLDIVADLALKGRSDRGEVLDQVAAITKLGMEGRIPFDESLQKRLALFSANQGHFAQVAQHLKSRVTPSFVRNRDFIQRNSRKMFIVSGGFTDCIAPTAEEYGIARSKIQANLLRFDRRGKLLGVVDTPSAQAGGKTKAVRSLGLQGKTVVIGDGMTDYHIRRDGAADEFVAFVENVERERVVKVADRVAKSFEEIVAGLEQD